MLVVIKELGLKDHDSYGFWGLSPEEFGIWTLWAMLQMGGCENYGLFLGSSV